MAATTQKKQTVKKAGTSVWQAHPDDAIRLAAMRWFALEIERLTIEIYATDKSKYLALEKTLRATVKALGRHTKRKSALLASDDDCPVGYVLCRDGLCAPMCDGYNN